MGGSISTKYNSFITGKGNIIWMGTMSLAWQQFASFSGVNKLQFLTKKESAIKTINNFNESPFSKNQIDQNSVYAKAGKGPETEALINAQVKKKFPNYSFPPLNYEMQDQDIISFAYLFKQLTFEAKFERRKGTSFQFNGKKFESFYASDKEQKEQISVHNYKDKDNFFISIPDKSSKDSIYFIKTDKNMTVDDAIKEVVKSEGKGTPMPKKDRFQMPVIDLECKRDYKEMIGLLFKNEELKNYVLAVMTEALKLKVDESGAKVQSMAAMMAMRCLMPKPEQPRYFILDKTFWIVMKEQGKHPYLCVKIKQPQES